MSFWSFLAFPLFTGFFVLAFAGCHGPSSPEPIIVVPAFPGAEGCGALTRGGRGGRTLIVTNLRDRGPGSLREAVETPGARTVVFEVSGDIVLHAPLVLRFPHITIAGQTAPGGGICIRRHGLQVRCSEVILRHFRVRPGDEVHRPTDAISILDSRRVILDHISCSWGNDEVLSAYGNQDLTVQWCIISEGLHRSHHPKGPHSMGGIWGGPSASFHHNLLAHHDSRTPRLMSRGGNADVRNNLIYNWGQLGAYGGEHGRFNLVANTFRPGPATPPHARRALISGEKGKGIRIHLADNVLAGANDITADNWLGYHEPPGTREGVLAPTPFDSVQWSPQSAAASEGQILASTGAGALPRDPVDARIVAEARDGTAAHGVGGIIDSQEEVGGWPELKAAPAPQDSDRDGMPDGWERVRGLDPHLSGDAPLDPDLDGYTNLEDYLNGLAGLRR